jgi:hypothetical protein
MRSDPVRAALALAGAALISAAAARAGTAHAGGRLFRLRLRPGDEWRERVLHEIEVLDGEGRVVWTHRSERVETVSVLSLATVLGSAAGSDRRWVRVRRTPEAPNAGPEPPEAAPPPYEVLVSSLGELAIPPPEDSSAEGTDRAAARAARAAGLVSRFAPVLPEGALAVGGSASRTTALCFAPGGGAGPAFTTTETVTLAPGSAARGDVARFVIKRSAGEQTVPLAHAALAAPAPGALVAVPSPVRLDVRVLGASGDGELHFDAARGVMLSYGMRETFGLAARLGRSSVGRTIHVSFEIERVEP